MQIEDKNYRLQSPYKIKDTIKAVYFDLGNGYKRTGSLCSSGCPEIHYANHNS